MAENSSETHQQCVERFIELANGMRDEGIDPNMVSHSLMSASGVYTSYVIGGNEGGLTETGIDKVVDVYRQELQRIESIKQKKYPESESG
ncbi:MAG: DUF3144 domain-containing protein [Pseudomonadota bacterium]